MEKVRVGIVGCGAITQRRHAPEYAENPNVEMAGFTDFNHDRAAEMCRLYGGKVYADFEEILLDDTVSAVSICSPNSAHAAMSIRALGAGKNVLCEKPMALTLEETRAMLEAEKASGKTLMIGHNQRLIPAHLKAREILSDGAIGKPLFFQCNFKHAGPEAWSIDNTSGTWFFRREQAHFGVLGDLGAHKIDLIRFLTGSEIKSVFASVITLDKKYPDGRLIDLEDNVVCQFKMENGMPGIMHFSWTNYGQEDNSTVVYGDKGVMKIFGDYADDIVLEMRDATIVKYHIGAISTNAKQLRSGVIDEFIAAIVEKRSPLVTGVDGHNTLAVITAGLRSSAEGRWLDVEY